MQVLEPIGRHALNVRATLQTIAARGSQSPPTNHVRQPWTRASYSKGEPPRTMFNGAKPLVALTRGNSSSTGSREKSKGERRWNPARQPECLFQARPAPVCNEISPDNC